MSWRDVPSANEWGRRCLGDEGRAIAKAALEAILCDHRDGRLTVDEGWCETVTDDYDLAVGNTSLPVRKGVRAFLSVLEWLPPVVTGHFSRMSKLELSERVEYLDALERHAFAPLTMLLIATKVPMMMSAYETGAPLRQTGFDRTTTATARNLGRERLRVIYGEDEPTHAERARAERADGMRDGGSDST